MIILMDLFRKEAEKIEKYIIYIKCSFFILLDLIPKYFKSIKIKVKFLSNNDYLEILI